jgi:hypothetical protein
MTPKQAIKILRLHRLWRRGEEIPMQDPSKIGEAIEVVCDAVESLERERDKMKTAAGELIAMIRVNVMRDTFRDATIEQVDEHLKPWIEKVQS